MKAKVRYWEIDFLRGIAIAGMVWYHVLIDLSLFKIRHHPAYPEIYGINLASIFILVSGVSLTITFLLCSNYKKFLKKSLIRGIEVFVLGLFISLATYLFIPGSFVRFGILHLLGISIIVGSLLIRLKYYNALIAFILIYLGNSINTHLYSNELFIWIGIRTSTFNSLDYFPIVPWLGFFMLGVILGFLLYDEMGRKFYLPEWGNYIFVKVFTFLGKRSLLVYLIHQPVIIGILILAGLISIKQIWNL